MIFNGVEISDYAKVISRKREFAPPSKIMSSSPAGTDGARFMGSNVDVNYFSIRLEVSGSTDSEIMGKVELINTLLYTKDSKELILLDRPNRYYLAKYESTSEIERYGNFLVTEITFIAFDPFAKSLKEKVLKDINGKTLINSGIHAVWGMLEIDITSKASELVVTLENNGEYIRVVDSFNVGDKVIIDLEKETVFRGYRDLASRIDYNSDFFAVPTGDFTINSSVGNVSLTFREEWL